MDAEELIPATKIKGDVQCASSFFSLSMRGFACGPADTVMVLKCMLMIGAHGCIFSENVRSLRNGNQTCVVIPVFMASI